MDSTAISREPPIKPHLGPVEESQLARLIEERDSLLNSGVYEEDDPIIVELNHEISRILEPPGILGQPRTSSAVATWTQSSFFSLYIVQLGIY